MNKPAHWLPHGEGQQTLPWPLLPDFALSERPLPEIPFLVPTSIQVQGLKLVLVLRNQSLLISQAQLRLNWEGLGDHSHPSTGARGPHMN